MSSVLYVFSFSQVLHLLSENQQNDPLSPGMTSKLVDLAKISLVLVRTVCSHSDTDYTRHLEVTLCRSNNCTDCFSVYLVDLNVTIRVVRLSAIDI